MYDFFHSVLRDMMRQIKKKAVVVNNSILVPTLAFNKVKIG